MGSFLLSIIVRNYELVFEIRISLQRLLRNADIEILHLKCIRSSEQCGTILTQGNLLLAKSNNGFDLINPLAPFLRDEGQKMVPTARFLPGKGMSCFLAA